MLPTQYVLLYIIHRMYTMYCTICMYSMCLSKEGAITLQRGKLSVHIVLVEAVWLRWNALEKEKFVPSLKVPENVRRCFWSARWSQDSKLWACITNEERDSRENKWDLNTSLRNAEKRYFSQRPRKDSKEVTAIQKGTKNWWSESKHEERTCLARTQCFHSFSLSNTSVLYFTS